MWNRREETRREGGGDKQSEKEKERRKGGREEGEFWQHMAVWLCLTITLFFLEYKLYSNSTLDARARAT